MNARFRWAGPMYGAARQHRYLDLLRGPQGQAVTWQRNGSAPGPGGNTVLDMYTVRYEGIDKPVTLFFDWYHYTEPMASAGFVLDRFRVVARPAPPGAVAPRTHRTIVVVKAEECGDRRVTPTSMALVDGRGQSAAPIETFTVATRFASLSTGLAVPDGNLGAVFQVDGIVDGVSVRAVFSGPGCTGEPAERSWRLTVTVERAIRGGAGGDRSRGRLP